MMPHFGEIPNIYSVYATLTDEEKQQFLLKIVGEIPDELRFSFFFDLGQIINGHDLALLMNCLANRLHMGGKSAQDRLQDTFNAE